MIALAPIGGALGLVWLACADRLSRTAWVCACLALALLVVAAADRVQLALTMVVEAAVAVWLAPPLRISPARAVITSGFVNALTQPLLFVALPLAPGAGGRLWWLPFLLAEAVVVLLEAGLYLAALPELRARRGVRQALALSLAANAASALIGLALPG
jgi:hypothetical protein